LLRMYCVAEGRFDSVLTLIQRGLAPKWGKCCFEEISLFNDTVQQKNQSFYLVARLQLKGEG
jgi:hypothetical protein